jgi:phage host-nuclease inhibitor protein Gam
MLLGAAQVRFVDTKSKVDYAKEAVYLTPVHDDAIPVEWTECFQAEIDPNDLEREPAGGETFGTLPAPASKARSYAGWSKDLVNWMVANEKLEIYSSASLKLFSQPGEDEAAFRIRMQQSVREERDQLVAKLRQKYAPKIATLEDRLRRAVQAVQREREQSRSQQMDALASIGTGVLGALFGRRKMTTAAGSVLRGATRATRNAGDVGRAEETVQALEAQLQDLETQLNDEIAAVQQRLDGSSEPLEVLALKPKKANVQVRLLTLAWAPYGQDGKPLWE